MEGHWTEGPNPTRPVKGRSSVARVAAIVACVTGSSGCSNQFPSLPGFEFNPGSFELFCFFYHSLSLSLSLRNISVVDSLFSISFPIPFGSDGLVHRRHLSCIMKGPKGKGTSRVSKEALKPVDDRKVGKRKAAIKADKGIKRPTKKELKALKDPNKPKRPPSAFFVFLKFSDLFEILYNSEEFRQEYKRENPNVKAVSAVGKAGGQRWQSLTHDEKAPYEAKAAKRKAEYEKLMRAYDSKKASEADDEELERSKSEVNGEDEASEEEHHEDDEEEEDDDEDDEEDD
ncbi:High mobility group B protein 1, partial [Cucurbita argyrosperma subsp. argyrosperma]